MSRALTKTLSFRRINNPVKRMAEVFFAAAARRKGRAALGKLDDHLLRDIGVLPDIAATEAAKRFWQA